MKCLWVSGWLLYRSATTLFIISLVIFNYESSTRATHPFTHWLFVHCHEWQLINQVSTKSCNVNWQFSERFFSSSHHYSARFLSYFARYFLCLKSINWNQMFHVAGRLFSVSTNVYWVGVKELASIAFHCQWIQNFLERAAMYDKVEKIRKFYSIESSTFLQGNFMLVS